MPDSHNDRPVPPKAVRRKVFASDSGTLQVDERAVVVGRQADEIVHIQHADCGFFTGSDVEPTGESRFSMAGERPQGEDGRREVAFTLARALTARSGTEWLADPKEPASSDVASDWYLTNSGNRIAVQVTRVAPQSRWKELGATGRVEGRIDAIGAADEMWRAIQRKLSQQDARTILALDIRHPGLYSFAPVVSEFRLLFGARLVREVRYREVWAVGYMMELCHCLWPVAAHEGP